MTRLLSVLFVLLAVSVSAQSQNVCDTTRQDFHPCVGIPMVAFFCGAPVDGPLVHAIAVDGVPQPARGVLVRYGFNVWGQHLEQPNDVSQGGQVSYIPPGTVVVTTPGPHVIEITYGPNHTRASFTWVGVTVAKSPIGLPDAACPTDTQRGSR